jgi:ribonuclease VapC
MLLDASAVLALLQDEPGADLVRDALAGACISIVTLAEIIAKLCEKGASVQDATDAVDVLEILVLDIDRAIAVRSGMLRPLTRESGLSLGDRICLATAERRGIPVMTADRGWRSAALDVEIVQIR